MERINQPVRQDRDFRFGSQQLLFLVLSIFIVAITISVGVNIFLTQLQTQSRNALILDIYYIGSQALAYYRTPVEQGGGGQIWEKTALLNWLNFPLSGDREGLLTENGRIEIDILQHGHKLLFTGSSARNSINSRTIVTAHLAMLGPEEPGRVVVQE